MFQAAFGILGYYLNSVQSCHVTLHFSSHNAGIDGEGRLVQTYCFLDMLSLVALGGWVWLWTWDSEVHEAEIKAL
jgi:hypothetical protein